MKPQSALTAHATELLSGLGKVRSKRMFGGVGFYVDDVFIATIAFDALYLKVDDQTRANFIEAGGTQLVFEQGGKPAPMPYYLPPADAMESPEQMLPWARLAMMAALRSANAKPRKK